MSSLWHNRDTTPGTVVLLTDRLDRSQLLAESVRTVAECRVCTLAEYENTSDAPIGILADITLDHPDAKRCLHALWTALVAKPPMLHLARTRTELEWRAARAFGAYASLSADTLPRSIVTALFQQIQPHLSMVDLIVRREVALVGNVLQDLFSSVRAAGRVDPATVERGLDPVLRAIHDGGLTRWLDAIWIHDDATLRHCLLVAGLMTAFSASLGFTTSDQRRMTRGALVHDLGKARIPVSILNKPGKLDPDEMVVMRGHAAIGHEILLASGETDLITLALTRHHHELLDGTGYPDRLNDGMIGDPVRLLTICDIYAALIESRPYRAAMPFQKALGILREMTGKLDPSLVRPFAAMIEREAARPSSMRLACPHPAAQVRS